MKLVDKCWGCGWIDIFVWFLFGTEKQQLTGCKLYQNNIIAHRQCFCDKQVVVVVVVIDLLRIKEKK